MINVKKKISKTLVALIAVVMLCSSIGFAASIISDNNTDVSINNAMTVSNDDNSGSEEISTYGSGDKIAASCIIVDTKIKYEYIGYNGVFWTRDYIIVDLQIDVKIPGLTMLIVYYDPYNRPYHETIDLSNEVGIAQKYNAVVWNKVTKFTVSLYTNENKMNTQTIYI